MTSAGAFTPADTKQIWKVKMSSKIKEDTDNLIQQMIKVIEDWSDKSDDKNNRKHNALRRFGLQKYYKDKRSNADR